MNTVKTIAVELPERVTQEIAILVQNGWFADETEIIRMAGWEFVRRNRFALAEQFQRADIAWVLRQCPICGPERPRSREMLRF